MGRYQSTFTYFPRGFNQADMDGTLIENSPSSSHAHIDSPRETKTGFLRKLFNRVINSDETSVEMTPSLFENSLPSQHPEQLLPSNVTVDSTWDFHVKKVLLLKPFLKIFSQYSAAFIKKTFGLLVGGVIPKWKKCQLFR